MQNKIILTFDKRIDDTSIGSDQYAYVECIAEPIRPGRIITAKHFGASVYLEVIGIRDDGKINAVILELDDDIYDPDIIIVFEMSLPVSLSEEFVYSVDKVMN